MLIFSSVEWLCCDKCHNRVLSWKESVLCCGKLGHIASNHKDTPPKKDNDHNKNNKENAQVFNMTQQETM